jgi:hypothetical protein
MLLALHPTHYQNLNTSSLLPSPPIIPHRKFLSTYFFFTIILSKAGCTTKSRLQREWSHGGKVSSETDKY